MNAQQHTAHARDYRTCVCGERFQFLDQLVDHIDEQGSPKLTQASAPAGTLALYGHPGNEHLIYKRGEGGDSWYSVPTGRRIDSEDLRAGWHPVTWEVVS